MTCETCHGTKMKRTISPPSWRRLNQGVTPMSTYEKVPCPDCTPKPFAEVGEVSGSTSLFIAGRPFPIQWASPLELPHLAEQINTAVGAREAKLISKMEAAAAALIDLRFAIGVISGTLYNEKADRLALVALDQLRPEADAAPEYVHGDVACGLAWDLGTMRAKVEGEWGLLLDVMIEKGGESSKLAVAIADELGLDLSVDPDIFIEGLSDTELAQECVRRGWSFEGPPLPTRGMTSRFLATVSGVELGPWQSEMIDALPRPMTATEAAARAANRRCSIYGCDYQPEPNSHRCWAHTVRRPDPALNMGPLDADQLRSYAEMLGAPLPTVIAIDESSRLDDRTVAALVQGREVVRITNVETFGIPERAETPGPVVEFRTRERDPLLCGNRQCSRFNTRHGGIPCDTRARSRRSREALTRRALRSNAFARARHHSSIS